MPDWLRPVVDWLMPSICPRELEFARTRLDMKPVETVMHLERESPARLKSMVREQVMHLVRTYGLAEQARENGVK